MPRLEKGVGRVRPGYRLFVNSNELEVDSGRRVPYPTWIGFIRCDGKIDVWSPAAYKPRGYRAAARRMLEEYREEAMALCRRGSGG